MKRIQNFQSHLKGRAIVPSDPDYESARTPFLGGFDRRPALIVRMAEADDVARVVDFAREGGLELAVRSGGRSGADHSVSNGGVLIDLREMRAIRRQPGRRRAETTGEER